MRTLARLYKWTPFEIDKLFLDDLDMYGLYYWEADAKEYIKDINKSMGVLR